MKSKSLAYTSPQATPQSSDGLGDLLSLGASLAEGLMAILANKPAYKATPHPYSRPNLLSVLAGLQASIRAANIPHGLP